MKITPFLFGFFLSFAWADIITRHDLDTDPVFPKVPLQNLGSLKHLVNLAKKKNLNLAFLCSKEQPYKTVEVSVVFPLIKPASVPSQVAEDEVDNFLKEATNEKLAGQVVIIKENKTVQGWTNRLSSVPQTRLYEIFTSVKNGKVGFTWDDRNYASHYTFLTPGGKTTKIVYGDLDIEVVKSDGFTEDDINTVKKLLADAYWSYSPAAFPKALVGSLDNTLRNNHWQVVSGAAKNSYVKAKKLILLNLMNHNYLIYSN